MKKLIYFTYIQIGVNVIGLPKIIMHDFRDTIIIKKQKNKPNFKNYAISNSHIKQYKY
jgi:hypothetical protein